ncbi:transferase [Erysipelotrichaceae bacterium]|nr:transferase [Erysipelotrichaceae bacterium]
MHTFIQTRKVINASGRMTKLGVSTPDKSIMDAMAYGASQYVIMDELLEAANKKIATRIGIPAACICSSASSAIVLSIAAAINKSNPHAIQRLHQTANDEKKEVILLKGHNIDYGVPIQTMVELGGAKVVEVGSANSGTARDIAYTITKKTVAILFVKSHHAVQKNMPTLTQVIAVGRKYDIPVIVDAAAEEDLKSYIDFGASLVIYSGTKALGGPTSGFILCDSLEWSQNIVAEYTGIGRAMKVGKETIYGLVQAIDNYYTLEKKISISNEKLTEYAVELTDAIPGISAKIVFDESGRPIARVELIIEEQVYGKKASELIIALENGNPAIFTRNYQANLGKIVIDPRPLVVTDLLVIKNRLIEESEK